MKLLMILGLVLGTVLASGNQTARTNEQEESSTMMQRTNRLELSIVTNRKSYKRHSQFKLIVMLTNVDYTKDIFVYRSLGWGYLSSLTYTIRDASGKLIHPPVLADDLPFPIARDDPSEFVKLSSEHFLGTYLVGGLDELNLRRPGTYLLFAVCGNGPVFSAPESRMYQDTRKLLSAMDDVRSDSDKLAKLFKVGDERIRDLIHALDDPGSDIRLRAQIVIRYLGNAEGMKALTEWYSKQRNEHPIAGPVPLPLSEWDYKFIKMNFLGKSPQLWRDLGIQYIYALALDDSQQSKRVLDEMVTSATGVDENTFLAHAIQRVRMGQPTRLLPAKKDLAKLLLNNAFFVSTQDHKQASARVLGLSGAKDKALVELYINRGRLAEEWYHVVIRKCGQGWKFFSITPVAVS